MPLIDLEKVYESACAGCTRHGDAPGECYHDEPCERLIFAFTTAEAVDAVEVIRCKDCKHWAFTMGGEGDLLMGDCNNPRLAIPGTVAPTMCAHEFCSLGEREEHGDGK